MTYLAIILAATCLVLGFLLVCALVGYSAIVDELRTRLDRADAQVEEPEWNMRLGFPSRIGTDSVSDTPIGDEAEVIALREALDRRGADYPWDAS